MRVTPFRSATVNGPLSIVQCGTCIAHCASASSLLAKRIIFVVVPLDLVCLCLCVCQCVCVTVCVCCVCAVVCSLAACTALVFV